MPDFFKKFAITMRNRSQEVDAVVLPNGLIGKRSKYIVASKIGGPVLIHSSGMAYDTI